jgi:UDP-glucose:(heptosyl)LPS alpha-1,3-glucosyltransferase
MRIAGVADRLRIALITERFGRKFGGAEAYAVNLFEILSKRHDVTVIASEFEHDLPVDEISVKRLKGFPSWMRALHFAYCAKKLISSGFDVVHSHEMGPAGDVHVMHVVPVRYRRFFMRPKWRGYLSYLEPHNIAHLWLESCSLRLVPGHQVVAVSPSVAKQLQVAYPTLASIEMIPPGAHAQSIDPLVRSIIREQLGWQDTDVVCILVARNPLLKGLAVSLQALERLPERYKLVVLGADTDSKHYFFKHHAELKSRVRMLEPTSNVSAYFQSADICVHPTQLDSFAMAPLEAMAHGLPVVLSAEQYCGFAAYVRHQQDAWVLDDPRDAMQLTEALCALGERPQLREKFVLESKALVQSFSWESVAQRYETLYSRVMSQKKRSQSQPRIQ